MVMLKSRGYSFGVLAVSTVGIFGLRSCGPCSQFRTPTCTCCTHSRQRIDISVSRVMGVVKWLTLCHSLLFSACLCRAWSTHSFLLPYLARFVPGSLHGENYILVSVLVQAVIFQQWEWRLTPRKTQLQTRKRPSLKLRQSTVRKMLMCLDSWGQVACSQDEWSGRTRLLRSSC